ncbi:kinase-like protein [Cryomyces antarcticus]
MADVAPQRQLSLIPYPSDSREIVLRHGSAIVVYDERSKELSLRDTSRSQNVELTVCPYCHRPLREEQQSPERNEHNRAEHAPSPEASFVNPEYFRMLHHSTPGSAESSAPPSPRRHFAQPVLRDTGSSSGNRCGPSSGAQLPGSPSTSPPSSHGISSSAFSPEYFKRFFVEEGVLGRGGKGVVLLVRHMLDGVSLGHFACKRVPVGDDHEWLEKVLLEVQLLQNLSHQNLVSYRHVWLEDYQITKFGPSVPCAFILQQYCNSGDLHHYVHSNVQSSSSSTQQLKERLRRKSKGQPELPENFRARRRMPFEEIYSFFKDITSGLHHLHTNGYIHRDLKPSNCLLHNTGHKLKVLVSDFGEVQLVNAARRSTGATGTISYYGAYGNFTTKSDIFSLGMIVYFMCFNGLPYRNADDLNEENEDLDQLRDEITAWTGFSDERRARPDLPEELYSSLKRLLSLDPAERPETEEILQGIKAGYGVEEVENFGHGASTKLFEDNRSRISSADSPSPAPGAHSRKLSGSKHTRPRPSKLKRQYSGEMSRPQSPLSNKVITEERPTSPLESSIVLRTRKVDMPPQPPILSQRALSSPRLMLPPPPSLKSRTLQLRYDPTLNRLLKLAVFLFKTFSIFHTCSPLMANSWISYPLICMAALDVGLLRTDWVASLVLLGVHCMAVAVAVKWNLLCMRRVGLWEDL